AAPRAGGVRGAGGPGAGAGRPLPEPAGRRARVHGAELPRPRDRAHGGAHRPPGGHPRMTRTALGLAAALRAGELSAAEVARDHRERLGARRPVIGAVAATGPERTLAAAAESDRRLRAGTARPLEGVPFTVKDWIDVEGWRVLGAPTAPLADPDRRPAADATAVARLRAAGAVPLAISCALAEAAAHGRTRNRPAPPRARGGSSPGAAALVAAGASPLALGSDSGGSIRLPAAWCGAAGLKPTFGRVPLTGHFPRCGSLEDGRTVIG